jgi:hypothetical protein
LDLLQSLSNIIGIEATSQEEGFADPKTIDHCPVKNLPRTANGILLIGIEEIPPDTVVIRSHFLGGTLLSYPDSLEHLAGSGACGQFPAVCWRFRAMQLGVAKAAFPDDCSNPLQLFTNKNPHRIDKRRELSDDLPRHMRFDGARTFRIENESQGIDTSLDGAKRVRQAGYAADLDPGSPGSVHTDKKSRNS